MGTVDLGGLFHQRTTRRRMLAGLGLAAVGIASTDLIAACSSAPTVAARNKSVVINTAFDLAGGGLDAAAIGASGTTIRQVYGQLYQALVLVNAADLTKIEPYVASSWVASPDGLSITFKLRQDVRFSDGTPLTADDVVFSINRLNYMGGGLGSYVHGLKVSAIDKYTVLVASPTPLPAMIYKFAYQPIGIVNSAVVKANGGVDTPDAAKTDKATPWLNLHSADQPYILESIDPTSQIVLTANPKYWGPTPTYTRVVFRNEPGQTQVIDLEKGSGIVGLDLSPQLAASLNGSAANLYRIPALEMIGINFSVNPANSPVTANPNFRQAVRYGLDYNAMLAIAGSGSARSQGLLRTGIIGALPETEVVQRDVAKAQAFLASSGLSQQQLSIAMDYPTDQTPEGIAMATMAQQIQASLKEIGITVTLVPAPQSEVRTKETANKFQMQLQSRGGPNLDPTNALFFVPGGRVANIWWGWEPGATPDVDAVIKQIANATTLVQLSSLYQQEQRLSNDFAAFIPILSGPIVVGSSKSVSNVKVDATKDFRVWEWT